MRTEIGKIIKLLFADFQVPGIWTDDLLGLFGFGVIPIM